MQNQHQMIKDYRDLSANEIALMNEIKAAAENVRVVADKVQSIISAQYNNAAKNEAAGNIDGKALALVDAMRWEQIARDNLQMGFMALTRAVAQPTTF